MAPPLPLVPAPLHAVVGAGTVALGDDAVVTYPSEWAEVAHTFAADLEADLGVRVALDGETSGVEIALTHPVTGLLRVDPATGVRADGDEPVDERFHLTIDAAGIRVAANSAEGAYRGLTAIRQLAANTAGGPAHLPHLELQDGPRFAWRGLSLDIARTFHGPAQLRRVIDMLALYRFNVLHLHLTDDQGWRFDVPGWPELTSAPSPAALPGRPEGHLTDEDIASLVDYARRRFITIVPEVDVPGHAAAVLARHPELALGTPPFLALDPDHPGTWTLVDAVTATLARLFPTSARVHIGADEAFGMDPDAYARFVPRALESVRAAGRLPITWQEATRAGVGADTLVQWWIDPAFVDGVLNNPALLAMLPDGMSDVLAAQLGHAAGDVARALEAGARLLLSPASTLYLDHPHAEDPTDPSQSGAQGRLGLPLYPPLPLATYATADPLGSPGLADVDPERHVAGVECAVWCETVTDGADLEMLLMPRLAGVSEQAWGRGTGWEAHRDAVSRHATLWDARGWRWWTATGVDVRGLADRA